MKKKSIKEAISENVFLPLVEGAVHLRMLFGVSFRHPLLSPSSLSADGIWDLENLV